MRDEIKVILNKKMTRQEFLRYTGGALLVLLGFSNLLALLNRPTKTAVQPKTDNQHGFGSRKFGA
jgi:hypothetical protein